MAIVGEIRGDYSGDCRECEGFILFEGEGIYDICD